MKKIVLFIFVAILSITFLSSITQAEEIIEQEEKVELRDCKYSLEYTVCTYNGKEYRPKIIIYEPETNILLVEGMDYTLEYIDNINNGIGFAYAQGIGKYTGYINCGFTISKATPIIETETNIVKKIGDASFQLKTPNMIWGDNRMSYKTKDSNIIDVTQNGLVSIRNAGTAVVTLTAHLGQNFKQIEIPIQITVKKSVHKITYKKEYNKTYGNPAFMISAKLSDSGKLNYISQHPNIVSVSKSGKATIKNTGIAVLTIKANETQNYNAKSVNITIKVEPKKVQLISVNPSGNKTMTAKWTKGLKNTGYEIQYARDKNFKADTKIRRIIRQNTVLNTIGNLRVGRRYFVRVRAYTSVKRGNKTIRLTGNWSNIKKSNKITNITPKLNKNRLTLQSGKYYILKLIGTKVKSWKSSNRKIATVRNGKVIAKRIGRVTISCKGENGKTYKCSLKVIYTTKQLRRLSAGSVLDLSNTNNSQINNLFYIEKISDTLFQKMDGVSYHQNTVISRNDLRYIRLLHVGFDGKTYIGELVVNQRIASEILTIMRKLYDNKYQLAKMLLIDNYGGNDTLSMQDNNTSAFNFRTVSGSNNLSKHALGMAIDINPVNNPYVEGSYVSPKNGIPYVNRSDNSNHKITRNDLCYQLFSSYGYTWGGNWWSMKDYQHFEK